MDLHSTYKEKKKYTYIWWEGSPLPHHIYHPYTNTRKTGGESYNGGAAAGKGKDMN